MVAFVCGLAPLDEDRVVAYCRERLPEYMVPRKIYLLRDMPLNASGKIDRQGLVQLLEEAKGVQLEQDANDRVDHRMGAGKRAV